MVIQSSKSGKTSQRRSLNHLQAWFMANGFFGVARMVPFSAGTNGE